RVSLLFPGIVLVETFRHGTFEPCMGFCNLRVVFVYLSCYPNLDIAILRLAGRFSLLLRPSWITGGILRLFGMVQDNLPGPGFQKRKILVLRESLTSEHKSQK